MSSVRDIVMANKLKDGVQDALVYLRLLEGAKLAPVYERKRIQLMSKLLDLQGDTRKESVPKFEDDSDDEDDAVQSEESPQHSTPDRKPPERRNSKLNDIKTKFNQPSGKANYRYKTLEELKKESAMKKAGIRSDSVSEEPSEDKDGDQSTTRERTPPPESNGTSEEKVEEEIEELYEDTLTAAVQPTVIEPSGEGGTVQQQSTEVSSSSGGGGGHEKKGRGLIGKLFKGKGGKGEKSLSIPDSGSADNISQLSADNSTVTLDEEEGPSTGGEKEGGGEKGEEEGMFTSPLERVTRRLGKYNYQKGAATLNGDIFYFVRPKDKEGMTLSLVGAATAVRDSYQFELHTVDKSYTFRTESEELCIKWVELLKTAIDACTPQPEVEEEIEEEIEEEATVPQITVSIDNTTDSNGAPGGGGGLTVPEGPGGGGGNIRESLSYENVAFNKKKKLEMPDSSTLQLRGFIYKKGKFGWDKVWIVLTYDNTLYMSANESSKKVLQVIPMGPDVKVEKKKSPDKKYPHGLVINSGRIKETLATDSQNDFEVWLSYLNQATGSGDIQELLSEDEDAGELYEELELKDEPTPTIPVSPRPNHASFAPPPTQGIEEELYDDFDGDIYEGLDDIDIPPTTRRSPPPVSSIPSLPPRNEPKTTPPTLPPRRNPQPEPAPSLPPRPSKTVPAALDYEAPLPSPKIKQQVSSEPVDDEIYDDVIGAGQGEELEETYDDVASTQVKVSAVQNRISSGDLYEDMVATTTTEVPPPVEEEQEEYCDMILPQHVTSKEEEGEDPDELYVDVDPPPARPPPPSSSSNIPPRPPPPATVTTPPVTRPPPPKTTPTPSSPLVKQRSESPVLKKKTDSLKRTTETKSSTLPKNTPSPSATAQSPVATRRPVSTAVGSSAKRLSGSGAKVAHLSKMFGDAPTQEQTSPKNRRGTHSGTILYMGPGKKDYSSDWCVLEGTTLIFYKGPNEKLSHFRLSTKEAELHMGLPDGKGSPFSFYIKKGSIIHKFSTSTLEELGDWIGPIANVITKVFPPPDCLYQAKEDHNQEGNGVSFKKDDIVWVLGEDTPTNWVGVVGSSVSEFKGSHGVFPSNKIGPLSQTEAMYI